MLRPSTSRPMSESLRERGRESRPAKSRCTTISVRSSRDVTPDTYLLGNGLRLGLADGRLALPDHLVRVGNQHLVHYLVTRVDLQGSVLHLGGQGRPDDGVVSGALRGVLDGDAVPQTVRHGLLHPLDDLWGDLGIPLGAGLVGGLQGLGGDVKIQVETHLPTPRSSNAALAIARMSAPFSGPATMIPESAVLACLIRSAINVGNASPSAAAASGGILNVNCAA